MIGDRQLPLALRADLVDCFSESDLPWRVDIVALPTTGGWFRKIIASEKVVIQQAANGPSRSDEAG